MGFDTVHFRLLADEVGGTDLMAETPNYLTFISEHTFADGQTLLAGRLVGCGGSCYKVSITPQRVTISDCSLSKWELGSNMLEMDRKATKEAVMCISDLLRLPIDRATVTRMDFAMNVMRGFAVIAYEKKLIPTKWQSIERLFNAKYLAQLDKKIRDDYESPTKNISLLKKLFE